MKSKMKFYNLQREGSYEWAWISNIEWFCTQPVTSKVSSGNHQTELESHTDNDLIQCVSLPTVNGR